jgi:3-methylcrotonyl-CoA carboxylase alpha subunit
MSFGKVLIANRGEIAVRIIRACRELDIKTVAVFSEADRDAMHRRLADEAYPIGPAPAAESYLNAGSLISAIKESGAQAVHPGYGFLSESAAFARAVEEAGAVWVGPPPEAMDLVGDKARAKELARQTHVPTVPGFEGEGAGEARLAEEAKRIGYPVLVKARAGGGGRGMRAVSRPEDFSDAVRGAKREAEAAFGDGLVYLEKLIRDPRHVEVQVIGDRHGNVLHLGERECSIQRRHQKVVEEAPSAALDPELRARICAASVRLTREAGYRNAGTVEFLLGGEDFYFLEMNARLQVEHPVTELVTGLDLVHLQLAVAAGEELPLSQRDVAPRGSAIEARLYAEDERGFPSSGGRLLNFAPPEGPGIRNDVGVEPGDRISSDYDPMLAKLIVFAPDRPTAVRRLRSSLADYEVSGVATNLPLLRRIAAHPAFARGETTTRFLQTHRLSEPPTQEPAPREALLLAATAELSRPAASPEPFAAGTWGLLGAARLRYRTAAQAREVTAGRARGGRLLLRLDDEESLVEVRYVRPPDLRAHIDGFPFSARVYTESGTIFVSLGGETYPLDRPAPPGVEDPTSPAAAGLVAPMPGTVARVLVSVGDAVQEGQLLLVLEAMKMEQPFTAPRAGRVMSLPFREGTLAPVGAVLVQLEEDADG